MNKGEGTMDAVMIIAFLIFVMLVTPRGSGTSSSSTSTGFFSGPSISSSGNSGGGFSTGSISSAPARAGTAKISIYGGNASYSYQPYEEYIEVENWGDAAVDITGWQLKNGKDQRAYNVGSGLQHYSADVATIPQATLLLQPNGKNVMQDVILGRGERAVITTGSVGVRSPYVITSFKENSCTGYLERLSDYAFQPSLNTSCPQPRNEPGLSAMDIQCRMFVESFSSCTTPDFQSRENRLDQNGQTCETCLNGTRLSSACVSYIKEHFSYRGCIAYHAGDSDFRENRTWRIFLGRSWEMWAENYESINLFDRFGTLVSSLTYR